MNTEKAIKLLREMQEAWKLQITVDAFDALEMAITALENAKNDNLIPEFAQTVQKQALKMQKLDALGAKTGETCSDTISRQAAIDEITEYGSGDAIFMSVGELKRRIEHLPPAQPETAKRIVGKSRDGMALWYQCDMCNEPVDAQDNFCSGCGRRLVNE